MQAIGAGKGTAMQGARGHATHARYERALHVPRPRLWRGFLCVLMSSLLALAPVEVNVREHGSCCNSALSVNLRQSEAHAFAPVVAGGAAALAAEIGVSEAALYGAIAAAAAAATGLGVAVNSGTFNSTAWPTDRALPGFKPWDDLTSEEQGSWGDINDAGTISQEAANRIYWQKQMDLYALKYGLLEQNGNGGTEPTPEPDDSGGKKNWQKKRNVLVALAAGGVVSLADAVLAVGEDFIGSLFKPSSDDNSTSGLGLTYSMSTDVDGIVLNTAISTPPTDLSNGNDYVIGANEWAVYSESIGTLNNTRTKVYYWYVPTEGVYRLSLKQDKYVGTDFVAEKYIQKWETRQPTGIGSTKIYLNDVSFTGIHNASSQRKYFINLDFNGNYEINGNEYTSSDLRNASTTDYGQMVDTPVGLANNVYNYNNLMNWANDYYVTDNSFYRGVTMPSEFTGVDGSPVYDDYVETYAEINPVPDDEQLSPDDVSKPSEPSNPDWDFGKSLGDVAERLQDVVFTQLFPFCLIGDVRTLVEKVSEATGGGGTRRLRTMGEAEPERSYVLSLDLSGFGVQGLETFEIDMKPLADLGHMLRPWWTWLIMAYLLTYSVKWFLKS